MNVAPFRVIVIGLGRHGLAVIKHLSKNPNRWTIAGAIDPSAAAFARFQSIFYAQHIACFKSVEDADVDADLVLVATTAPFHVRAACELIRQGYAHSILVEKPISTSVDEACVLLRATDGWGGRIGVDFNRRCSSLYAPLRELIDSNALGALRHIQYNARSKISMKGSHFIDLALWSAGSRPMSVSATLEEFSTIDPRGAAFFDPEGCIDVAFTDGMTFQLDATGRNGTFESGMTWVFERGAAHVDVEEKTLLRVEPEGEAHILAQDPSDRFEWVENTMYALVSQDSPYTACSLPEAITNLEILVGAFLSNRQGHEPIALPLADEYRRIELQVA